MSEILTRKEYTMKKLKKFGIGAATVLVAIGVAQGASANVSTNVPIPIMPKHSEIKAMVEERFADYDKSDKILPVDGGYLYGKAVEIPLINGKEDKSKAKKFNSSTDSKSITVAKAIAIEIKEVESGLIIGSAVPMNDSKKEISNTVSLLSFKKTNGKIIPLGTAPATGSIWILDPGDIYDSQSFSGSGWRYAGHFFRNADGFDAQEWRVHGDSGLVGNYADATNNYYNGYNNAYPIYPSVTNPAYTRVSAGDGSATLTFFTYNPIPGSGYRVIGF